MTGLLLAGLFAAAMSSLDSGINSMTASLVSDWLGGREVGMRTNRWLTFGFGVGVTLIACLLSLINSPVFDILLSIAGATLGLLLAVLMMGMLLPRVNTLGCDLWSDCRISHVRRHSHLDSQFGANRVGATRAVCGAQGQHLVGRSVHQRADSGRRSAREPFHSATAR